MDVLEKEQFARTDPYAYWYYQAKFSLLRKHFAGVGLFPAGFRCLDFGCGVGIFLDLLVREGLADAQSACGIDCAYQVLSYSESERVPIWPRLEDVGRDFDVALLMDVLEHVEDEKEILRRVAHRLRPGGYVFVTVPAHRVLWSFHDVYLGHFRRYSLADLRRVVESTGELEVVRGHYYFAWVLPVAILVRAFWSLWRRPMGSDLQPLPKAINHFLRYLCLWELESSFQNKFCGLSAVIMARRKHE
jgi:SAM-dependent methyltransferase